MKSLFQRVGFALATLSAMPAAAQTPIAVNPAVIGLPGQSGPAGDDLIEIRGASGKRVVPATFMRQRPLPVSRFRVLGSSMASGVANVTFHMLVRAPAEYDAIQLVMSATSNDSTNAVKFTVAAPDAVGDSVNPTLGGAAVTPTTVTWGTTSPRNPRNPGGGATTVLQSGFSGTAPNTIEGVTYSDIIPLASVARTDQPGVPPLLMVREFAAANAPISTQLNNLKVGFGNPAQALLPDAMCGYISGDVASTASGVAAPLVGAQGFCPGVEVIYYLRGQRIYTIASAGDSLDQGFCGSTAVNCSPGTIGGVTRSLAAQMTAAGNPTGFAAWHMAGQTSGNFNERALNGLMLGDCAVGVTHLFFKPWSVNEGTGTSTIAGDLRRADHILDWAYKCGITPILVYPRAGEGMGTAPNLQTVAYIDAAKARGVPTFDGRAIVGAGGSITTNTIRPEYLSLASDGSVVDTVHLNGAGQAALAAAAYAQRAAFNLP